MDDGKISLTKIPHLPGAAYYVHDFVTTAEETYILEKFRTRPASTFRNLSHRRLQIYPAELNPRNNVLPAGPLPEWIEKPVVERLLQAKFPAESSLSEPTHLFDAAPHKRPTHALLNEYEAGVGIAAHEDGPAYFPLVSTVSLGSHTVLELRRKETMEAQTEAPPVWRLLLEPRSLFVLGEGLYRECLHEIANIAEDEMLEPYGTGRGLANWTLLGEESRETLGKNAGRLQRQTRVSVTLRDVWKMRDFGKLVPGLRKNGF